MQTVLVDFKQELETFHIDFIIHISIVIELATINTAVNVFEKKAKSAVQTNGTASKIAEKSKKNISNGFHENLKKRDANKPVESNTKTTESFMKSSVANVKNGIIRNIVKEKINKDEQETKKRNGVVVQNGIAKEINNKTAGSKLNGVLKMESAPRKITGADMNGICNGEISAKETVLPSILKKSVSTKSNQPRRPSVGFAAEEPVVIGYGGRDFTSDELEWEMASSDGEGGTASFDENEDDIEFSKATRDNTDFNSDNINLLQRNGGDNTFTDATSNIKNATKKQPENKTVNGEVVNGTTDEKASSRSSTATSSDCIKQVENFNKKEIGIIHKNNTAMKRNKKDIDDSKPETSGNPIPLLSTSPEINKCDIPNILVDSNKEQTETKSILNDIKVVKPFNCKVDASRDVCSDVSSVSSTADDETSDENITSVPHGASVASERKFTVVKNNSGSQSLGDSCNLTTETDEINSHVRAFDDEFLTPQNDSFHGVNTDRVHEAFNTTLVALKNMENGQHTPLEENACVKNNYVNHEDISAVICTSENTVENVRSADDLNKTNKGDLKKNCITDSSNVEPRTSFLHSTGSNYKEENSNLSAIYAPGADFFVSRRNSVSSTSSSEDEQKPTIVTITEKDIGDLKISKDKEVENDDADQHENHLKFEINKNETNLCSQVISSAAKKPQIPIKPRKAPVPHEANTNDDGHYAKPLQKPQMGVKLLSINEDTKEICTISAEDSKNNKNAENHYAEVNIYDEISSKVLSILDCDSKDIDVRESKLAALAMELEQARHSSASTTSNSKRQAPSPPKIPDPPQEDPPSSLERPISPIDEVNTQAVFRGDIPFSSASSTTSSSSQDDTGFGSWALHGDSEESTKSSKWKNSFLLTQYSKCKMLAMGYGEEKSKSKKKFSLKKLLKLGKDAEVSINGEIPCSGRKAWKYNDNFDRPRPKLDIIHPMDLENKSLMVNPGFDPVRSSTSSFTSGVEVISIRNSTSSDYGAYYSDTAEPQETQGEMQYEYVAAERCHTNSIMVTNERHSLPNLSNSHLDGSTSPTPSRCSAYSQASTLTSGSSKNGSCSTPSARPPKPPPPPRAHSLLTCNGNAKNGCKAYKQSLSDDQSSSGGSVFTEDNYSPLPQPPKRLYRSNRGDYANFDTKSCSSLDLRENDSTNIESVAVSVNGEDCAYEYVGRISQQYEDVEMVPDSKKSNDIRCNQFETKLQSYTKHPPATKAKSTPLTKAPSRPPPLYTKLPNGGIIRENAWKSLEGSYSVLSCNNREILVKLIEQTTKQRPLWIKHNKEIPSWEDFKLDAANPAKFFSCGDQVVYDAVTLDSHKVTLLINLCTEEHSDFRSNTQIKYPVFTSFKDNIPSRLLLEDVRSDLEMGDIQTTVYVLHRSIITSLDNYIQDLTEVLNENLEKELAFILLQVIQELKGFQVQGIEELEASFKSLMLVKTADDNFHTLLFMYNDYYEESGNAYSLVMDDCKVSLCQFALMLVYQLFKVESTEELSAVGGLKFSKQSTLKIFESVAGLLLEEKAVSLSQAKTLLECFLWGVQALVHKNDFDFAEADVILHRWIDIERSAIIKNFVNNAPSYINTQTELYAQFLLRSNVKNIKDILQYL